VKKKEKKKKKKQYCVEGCLLMASTSARFLRRRRGRSRGRRRRRRKRKRRRSRSPGTRFAKWSMVEGAPKDIS